MSRLRWDPRWKACISALTTAPEPERVPHGLVDLLRNADQLRSPEAPTPGEAVALVEFLMAICYAADSYPRTTGEWRKWVEEKAAEPLREAAEWLAAQPDDEWDLFHPVTPLGQNALLAPFLDAHGTGPAQLVIERVGDYNQFFDHHHLVHAEPLPADAAFRAVLTQHVYGPGGRARISGKATLGPTLTNLAVGRLGGRVRVIALGATLGETLRLNLTPHPEEPAPGELNLSWTSGAHERRGFRTKPQGREPVSPADLHSVLGRSILLRPTLDKDGREAVDRVLIGAGELVSLGLEHLQDAVLTKTMAGAEKPLWPSSARAVWRDAHALYAAVADPKPALDLYGRLAMLPSAQDIRLWAVGLVAKQTRVETWVSESFPLRPGRAGELWPTAKDGSDIAEYVAASLGKAAHTAWTIAYPNPKPADKAAQIARFDARRDHYKATAEPFQVLLGNVAEDLQPRTDAVQEYAETLAAKARDLLTRRLETLPRNAQGYRVRAEALARLDSELHGSKAPKQLRGNGR
ncbi:type I-E CRISPR-associated protein Cse1/CasA [Streptomyces sp. NPDC005180]|uniref:type I-E CRISPR-associated protein Cse1/CasA n=1 Tax=Streptomyces sp. NPDC005180 TaxID=3156868 RepID=UPI0033AFF429